MNTEEQRSRNILIEGLNRYLIGPSQVDDSGNVIENETVHAGYRRFNRKKDGQEDSFDDITQRPNEHYHIGYLAPREEPLAKDEDDQLSGDDGANSGAAESIMVLSNAAQQGAMGLTVKLSLEAKAVNVETHWSIYHLEVQVSSQEESETDIAESVPEGDAEDQDAGITESDDKSGHATNKPKFQNLVWRRTPKKINTLIDLADLPEGKSEKIQLGDDHEGVELVCLMRNRRAGQFLTVSLVNSREKERCRERNEDPLIYQTELILYSEDLPCFLSSTNTGLRKNSDHEYWADELLYRNSRQYGIGHGVAVIWDEVPSQASATLVRTVWIPEVEVYKASANALNETKPLDLEFLSEETNHGEIITALSGLAAEYETWIDKQKQTLPICCQDYSSDVRPHIEKVGQKNLDACQIQAERIRAGIEFLRDDHIAFQAFCLMNRAMALAMEKSRPDIKPAWYAFQLAFIVLVLPSVANRRHSDRQVFDLIWFPTGGGKTEAYLGLTAFVLFYRYLKSPAQVAGGTAVITRYTLRLLTSQQFERAALTILACEIVRRQCKELAEYTPYSIGLLVGRDVTPNDIKDAKKIKSGKSSQIESGKSLLPIDKCPWCRSRLSIKDIEISATAVVTRCANRTCDFSEPSNLPITVVDEDIYNNPPSFVIGTIDKFAQLARKPDMAKVLGCHSNYDPPDLILQDELHLVNDALGTVTALYEMAIEFLATQDDDVVPKIVGSTATIRQADLQVQGLFRKSLRQFPPSALEASDSFFYATDTSTPGRTYLGIHAQGKSPKYTLARVMGLAFQLSTRLEDYEQRDPFHTVVTYFNSLRELGGAHVIAEDDMPRYLESAFRSEKRRKLIQKIELTGQVPSDQIKNIFRQLEDSLLDSEGEESDPLDLVLASNMMSVGVDISRLGLMIVNGQPKTSAEYIQATSRIGRKHGSAGLVITLYNWTRPRDRSHYERFVGYHQAFYRYVEAISVTPFAARARQKALKGALVAMIRSGSEYFKAEQLDNQHVLNLNNKTSPESIFMESVKRMLNERVASIDEREESDTMADYDRMIQSWISSASKNHDMFWTTWSEEYKEAKEAQRSTLVILSDPADESSLGMWPVPYSMRDVDPSAPIASVAGYQ